MSYGAQSARFILDSRLPTSAPVRMNMQSAPLPVKTRVLHLQ
jgi:hypothetical protein